MSVQSRGSSSRGSISLGGEIEDIDGVTLASEFGVISPFSGKIRSSDVLGQGLRDVSLNVEVDPSP